MASPAHARRLRGVVKCLQLPTEAARERSEADDEEEAAAAAAEGAGAEEAAGSEPPLLTWDEIMSHRFLADFWVVIDGFVYDMTCALRPSFFFLLLRDGASH